MNRSSSEKLSGSMRQAVVTALFRFLSRAVLRTMFSFIDTIFTWKEQRAKKGIAEAGVAQTPTVLRSAISPVTRSHHDSNERLQSLLLRVKVREIVTQEKNHFERNKMNILIKKSYSMCICVLSACKHM